MVEVAVRASGDVNRHSYADVGAVSKLAADHQVDLVDISEEPFSRAAGQLLHSLPPDLPVVMYSAQNLDKRWPPPYRTYERNSFHRVQGFYPCSRQAASVLRGKGFAGLVDPLPLGYDDKHFYCGAQSLLAGKFQLALVGRMVREKGVLDAVHVLANLRLRRNIDAHLMLVGSGPALRESMKLATELDVARHVEHVPWLAVTDLAALYRNTHVVLTPSRSTATWAEQFGRMVVEAQASGCVVLGYDSGSIPEVGGTAARLVREGDTGALAEAVALTLSDEDEFQAMRTSGLALARDKTWSRVASKQVDFYRAALRQGPAKSLAASPRLCREIAVAEFGRPGIALGQARPFALPLLRRPNAITGVLGRAMDLLGEMEFKARRGGEPIP